MIKTMKFIPTQLYGNSANVLLRDKGNSFRTNLVKFNYNFGKEKKNTKGTEVIQEFGVGDSYERRGYQGYQKKPKFKFNDDDFPKMK